jgi:hypothetical protein
MKHFDISQWTDFGRGMVSGPERVAMETHLSVQGCARCRATLDLVRGVVSVARAADRNTPPDYAVRCAKALSALLQPQKARFPSLIAHLIYDSFRDPLPAGMRSQDRLSRQALYEAGDFCLDLRLEHDRGTPLVTLVGQLTNRTAPDSSVPEAPVLLMARNNVVAHTVSNPFGEFQMEYAPSRSLRLCVPLDPSGKRIEVSLNRLAGETSKSPAPRPVTLRRLRRKPAGQRRNRP